MNRIYRVVLTGRDSSGVVTTFHYATHSYTASPAHTSIPNVFVDGRVEQPLAYQRDLFGEARRFGQQEIPHGECILTNADGALDGLLAYGFDGGLFELYKVGDTSDTLEFRGSSESVTLDMNEFRILIRDMSYQFDVALQPTKFAGNNSLPNGLEGTSDLQGRPKPVLYGTVLNVEPPCVNTTRLIYQVHDGLSTATVGGSNMFVRVKGIGQNFGLSRTLTEMSTGMNERTASSVDTVNDWITFAAPHGIATAEPVNVQAGAMPGGVLNTVYYYARAISLTQITLHPTATDATNNTNKVDITSAGGLVTVATNRTPLGAFDVCSDAAGTYFRLGSSPNGVVTYGQTTTSTKTQEAFVALAARVGTFAVIWQPAATNYEAGFYWDEETTIYNAMCEVLKPYRGSFHFLPADQVGAPNPVIRILPASGGSPLPLLDESSILSIEKIQSQDELRDSPAWRVKTGYSHNHRVQLSGELTSLTPEGLPAQLLKYGTEYLWRIDQTSSIKNQFPQAPEVIWTTGLTSFIEALAVATSLKTIFTSFSIMFRVKTSLEMYDSAVGIPIGNTGSLTHSRFGLSVGKSCTVYGFKADYAAGTVELIVSTSAA